MSLNPSRRLWLAFAALAAIGQLAIVTRPRWCLGLPPISEDGFYALAIARNIAAGRGVTIDGDTWTNGFQPLFTMLEAAVFWLAGGSQFVALRLTLVLGWLVQIASAPLAGFIARDAWPARDAGEARLRVAAGTLLWMTAPFLFAHAYNGLETNLTLLGYLVAARIVQTGRDRGLGGALLLGAVLGVTILARIDAVLVAAALALRGLWRARTVGLRAALIQVAALSAAALAISAPWWMYNVALFGSPIPISGTIQRAWAVDALRLEFAERAVLMALFPWIYGGDIQPAPDDWLRRGAVLLTLAVLGAGMLRRASARSALAPDPAGTFARTRELAWWYALACAALVCIYTLDFSAYWFYYRYFTPLAPIAVVAGAVMLARAAAGPRWRAAMAAAFALAITIQITAFSTLAWMGRLPTANADYRAQLDLVRDHVPAEEYVGASQSGTLGFFRARVVNLDGKVNPEAHAWQAMMWQYLERRRVRWFVGWPGAVERYLGANPMAHGWRLVARRDAFQLWRRD